MKRYVLLYALFIIVTVVLMPVSIAVVSRPENTKQNPPQEQMQKSDEVFLVKTQDGICEVDRLEYLICVTGSEIDCSYPDQAIKAQAVAAYTFALFRKAENTKESYDITDQPSEDQCYKPLAQVKKSWKDDYKRLEKCVGSVYGQYLVDGEGKPALTMYHWVSPGKTESAKDIFGADYAYLQSVDCSCDVLSPDYLTVKELTLKQFKSVFDDLTDLQEEPKKWFSDYNTAQGGSVLSVKIGDQQFTGEKVAQLLGLPSRAFDAVISENTITLRAKGRGHGVGMSQYGAYSLAKQGEDYKSILGYFYQGCKLRQPV